MMITVCVTTESKRSVVTCDSKTTTLKQFQELALNALGLSGPSKDTTTGSTTTEFYIDCFPQPRRSIITAGSSDDEAFHSQKVSLFDCGVRHQDRIVVVVIDKDHNSKQSGHKTTSSSNTAGNATSPVQQPHQQRGRRKAAIAATESFAATIQLQDEQMQTHASKVSPAKKGTAAGTKTSSRTSSSSSSTTRHFANLDRITSSTNEGKGGGRRLRDGAIATSPSRKRAKSGPATKPPSTNSDITEGLVYATTDTSSSARLMRKGWRQAVESAYEQNQANARVAAGQNVHTMVEFMIVPALPSSSSNAADADKPCNLPQQQEQLQVIFKKGVQGRGVYTDIVDYIDYDVLVATVTAIYPSEALRSFHLALLSPRVFWSLLYHFTNHITTSTHPIQDPGDVIQSSIKWCCPNLDWTYLRRRPEQLSEKAKENLRQKREKLNPTSNMDWDAAAAAILSVEQAMDDLTTTTVNGEICTTTVNTPVENDDDSWELFVDEALELDELITCIKSYTPDPIHDTEENCVPSYSLNTVVYALSQILKIRNSDEMANVSYGSVQMHTNLMNALSRQDEQQVPVTYTISNSHTNEKVPIILDAIEQWINAAQQATVHSFMSHICEDVMIVDIITDTLRCSTPKDLVVWESIPNLFVEQVHIRWIDVANAKNLTLKGMSEWESIIDEHITVSNVVKWCHRAHIAMKQVEWINNYVTGIDSDSDVDDD